MKLSIHARSSLGAALRTAVWTILALQAFPLFSQQTATATGFVTDASGAFIPGVDITLANAATGEQYSASSNEAGAYTIPFLKPGRYALSARAEGFKLFERTGIVVDTAAAIRLDVSLEIGTITEVVTVTADIPQLKTESSSVAVVIKNEAIANMPLVDRRAAQLVRLSGFVVQRGTGSTFQIAGGRGNNSMWTLDGGSTQNMLLGVASLNFDPPIEALDEFNIEVSNYKAEMGRSGGGFIQMTTKSGTNTFHGAAYNYLRNDALDTRQFFAAEKQKLRRNQFGWALGGPIVKDRTFFFASQEFTPHRSSTPVIENLPSPAERLGDFSGVSAVVRDPETGVALPNNVIPQSRIDPVGLAVAKFWPDPNIPGRPSRNRNYIGESNATSDTQTLSVRLDHTLSDRHRLFGRYVHNLSDSESNAGIWPNPVHEGNLTTTGRYYNWSVTAISNLSQRLIVENRFTWNKRKHHPIIAAKGLGLAEQIGIKGVDPDFFPGFGFTGGIQRIGNAGGQERRQFPIRDNHIANNWTYFAGKHTLKWGVEGRVSRNDDVNLPTAGGSFNFNSNAAGDPIAALLYGWAASGTRAQTYLIRSRANSVGAYIQDDWKISPRLTLNLGLRYDLDTPRFEKVDNRQNSFDVDAINPVSGTPGVVTWSGRTARNGSKYAHNFATKNLGPRIGLAYRINSKTVLRAGSSLIYAGQYDQATPIVANAGFSIQGTFTGLRPTDAAFLLRNGLPAIAAPTEEDLVPGFGAVPVGALPVFAPEFFQPNDRPMPYLIQYNFNLQRTLPGDILIELGYLSTLGRKLTIPGDATINQVHPSLIALTDLPGGPSPQVLRPFPQFSDVTIIAPTFGASEYHGVNIKVEKRYSHGVQFSMNYTFSRALDDVESRNELGGEDGNAPFSNQYDRSIAWSLGGNHIKHRYISSAVWELPWGRGRGRSFSNGFLNQIAGGWTVSGIVEARTGPPFSATWGNAAQIYPTAARVRADATGDYQANDAWRDDVLGQTYFDTSVFRRPARFTFGNVGRNAFTGPGALRVDASVIKEIYLPIEGHSLQLRGEAINLPNTANFSTPIQDVNSPAFGTITSLTPEASGRILQLGLRYAF